MAGQPFEHHAPAHPGQQQHGDPVVKTGDQVHHRAAQQGHAALKQPKVEGQAQDGTRCAGAGGCASAKRNREAVHSQPEGDHQQYPEVSHLQICRREAISSFMNTPAFQAGAVFHKPQDFTTLAMG